VKRNLWRERLQAAWPEQRQLMEFNRTLREIAQLGFVGGANLGALVAWFEREAVQRDANEYPDFFVPKGRRRR
jgi:DNA-binding transcriptional regulator of glucitol operon